MRRTCNLTILTLTAALLAGCNRSEKAAEAKPATPVGVEAVKLRNGQIPLRYSANLRPYEQVDLSFRVGGYVQSIHQVRGADGRMRPLQDGDPVGRGRVLATLRANDYTARVQAARAVLVEAQVASAKAELDYGRASRLFAAHSLVKPEFDAAKAGLEASQAAVDAAKERLQEARLTMDDTRLVSPIAGLVLQRNISAGALAVPGSPAFTVADTKSMKAVFSVPDIVVARMKPGKRLEVTTEAFPGEQLHGQITRISAAADPQNRVFEVEVTVPNPGERLRIGMIASLVLDEQKASEPVPVVPLSAIVGSKSAGKYAVYVLDRGVARIREIELGESFGNDVGVRRGLKQGEQVITTGANLITDGEAVQVVAASKTR